MEIETILKLQSEALKEGVFRWKTSPEEAARLSLPSPVLKSATGEALGYMLMLTLEEAEKIDLFEDAAVAIRGFIPQIASSAISFAAQCYVKVEGRKYGGYRRLYYETEQALLLHGITDVFGTIRQDNERSIKVHTGKGGLGYKFCQIVQPDWILIHKHLGPVACKR